MQKRHTNRAQYFEEQATTVQKHVIPFIKEIKDINQNTSILEIGCGEGGNLVPFYNLKCKRIVGIDMAKNKIENAKKFFNNIDHNNHVEFYANDIYKIEPKKLGQFDIIITRDVLEHIHNQEKFMHFVKKILKPDGKFFLGFPPWQNPFGGHQQMCESKLLSKIPYYHILPKPLYKFILKSFGESDAKIKGLLEIKDTGITIERFQKILNKEQYIIDKRIFYFINPNYEIKLGLKPRKACKLISVIPFLRNFFITTNYYLISKK